MANGDKNNRKKLALTALPVGIVSAVIGYVAIKGQDGVEKLLKLGDKLFSGDQVTTGDDGHAVIDLIDGSSVALDDNTSMVLDDDVIDARAIEQIQQAILAGISPSSGEAVSQGGFDIAQVNIDELSANKNLQNQDNDFNSENIFTPDRGDAGFVDTASPAQTVPDTSFPDNPLGKLPSLSISNVVVQEPAPAGSGGQGGSAGGGQGGSAGGGHEGSSDSGHDSGHESGEDSGHDSGHESGEDSGHDSGHESGEDSSHDSGHESGEDSGHDSGHDQGPVYAIFTLTLSHPALTDVSVDFSTANGTAVTGGRGVSENDYGQNSGTVIIPAGETTATIEIEIFGDRGVETDNEYFYVNLSNAHGASIADGQGIATIIDSGHGEGSTGEGDILIGTDGDDVLTGSGGRDSIYGEAGDDILSGRGGPDTMDGGEGNDILYGLGGPDIMSGGPGDDRLVGHGGPDVMDGGPGNDDLSGGGAPDHITGGEGDDIIAGGGGPDQLQGDAGNDLIYGDGGPDIIDGGSGNDILIGGGGPDVIQGGTGDDHIHGDGGPDVINGGPGSDLLVGGGAGDVFYFDSLQGADVISDFKPQQGDIIDISAILDGYQQTDPVSNYVQLQATAEPDTFELLVNPSGSSIDDFQLLVTLENLQHATTVDDLLDNGNLILTTVT